MWCPAVRRTTLVGMLVYTVIATVYALPAAATVQPAITTVDVAAPQLRSARLASRGAQPLTVPNPRRDARMVAIEWSGSASELELRVRRSRTGRWSGWMRHEDVRSEGPDSAGPEGRRADRRRRGDRRHRSALPAWTGEFSRVQIRIPHRGETATAVRLVLIAPPETDPPRLGRHFPIRARQSRAAAQRTGPPRPTIISRATWGADESIVRETPVIAETLRGAVVHHTVNSNSYSREQADDLIRGIQLYHVRTQGWNDIGYNFLVDRFGRVYEGRGGGTTRNVIGAHTGGFNTGTTGIAILGTHTSARPSSAARRAVTRLISWRLDLAHVRPSGTMTLTSAGNDSHPAGERVTRRAVVGHRDLFPSSCPGSAAWSRLPRWRRTAWISGAPKLADIAARPTVAADGSLTAFSLRGSTNRRMTSTLTLTRESTGATVWTATSRARSLNFTMPPAVTGLPAWDVIWTLSGRTSTGRATPATGRMSSVTPPLELAAVSSSGSMVAPDSDGLIDAFEATFSLNVPAPVTATVRNTSTSATTTIWRNRTMPAGTSTVTVDPTARALPDGQYTLTVTATDPITGRTPASRSIAFNFAVVRGYSVGTLPPGIDPTGRGRWRSGRTAVTAPAATTVVSIINGSGDTVRPLSSGTLSRSVVSVDGLTATGSRLPDGAYALRLTSPTAYGDLTLDRSFVIDTTAPRLTVRSTRRLLRIRSNEDVTLRIRFRRSGGSPARTVERHLSAGTWLRLTRPARVRKVVAIDIVGHRTQPRATWR